MIYYTYLYLDPSKNDEIFYIGKGTGNRANRHLKRKDRHPFVQRLQKMLNEGIQPIITKIECSAEKAAFDLEMGLIRLIGRKDKNEGLLLNLTNGGEGPSGYHHSETTKIKIGNIARGRECSKETRNKKRSNAICLHQEQRIGTKGKILPQSGIEKRVNSVIGTKYIRRMDPKIISEHLSIISKGLKWYNDEHNDYRMLPEKALQNKLVPGRLHTKGKK